MVCPVRTRAVSTECEWFPDWEDPNDCDCPHDGYSSNDGCYKFPIEVNGKCEWRVGKPLTSEKNKDHPLTGAEKANPTWDVRSLCGWFGSDGAQGPQTVTYEWGTPTVVDGVVSYTVTGSDGSTRTVTFDVGVHTTDTDTDTDIRPTQPNPIGADNILTIPMTDIDGNALTPLTIDFSAFMSSPHPTVTDGGAGDTIAVVVDASGNVTVNGSTMTQTVAGNVTTTTLVTPAGTFTWDSEADADVTVVDTQGTPTGSPVKVTLTGTNSEGDPEYTVDYDASLTPDTASAGAGPWRQVVEDPATGNEHVLRSGVGYREHHDGRVEMWGVARVDDTSEDTKISVSLPVALSSPITYTNAHISLQDVTWAGVDGEALIAGVEGGLAEQLDRFNQTDMGWAPSRTNPTTEFIFVPFQAESLDGNGDSSFAFNLISWKLTVEAGIL